MLVAVFGHRARRVAGARYPGAMLLIIVATSNHFLVDAALGGVVVLGWLAARHLVARPTATRTRLALADCPQT